MLATTAKLSTEVITEQSELKKCLMVGISTMRVRNRVMVIN